MMDTSQPPDPHPQVGSASGGDENDKDRASDDKDSQAEKRDTKKGLMLCFNSCRLNRVLLSAGEPPTEESYRELLPYYQSIVAASSKERDQILQKLQSILPQEELQQLDPAYLRDEVYMETTPVEARPDFYW